MTNLSMLDQINFQVSYISSVGKPEGKTPHGRPRSR